MTAVARPRTIGTRDLLRVVQGGAVDYPAGVARPVTRGDCERGERPCPFVSCHYHLAIDVSAKGALKVNREVEDLAGGETCALDVAGEGGATRDRIGHVLGITREAARLIELAALAKLRDGRLLEP